MILSCLLKKIKTNKAVFSQKIINFDKKINKMDLYNLAIILGVATYVFLLITFLIGFRFIKASFKKHRFFAVITLVLATLHAASFIYMNFF